MVTSLYETTKGNIMKGDMGRSLVGYFAFYSWSQILFSSLDNLYHRYLGIIGKIDRFREVYTWIISIEESMSKEASVP